MSEDGKFYYPNIEGQNFTNETTSADSRRIIYSPNDSKYIPTLYADDMLVYFTTGSIPTTIGVEKFCDSGYTCGLYGISQASNGNYTFTGDNFIPNSTLQSSFNGYVSSSDIATILSVDGEKLTVSDVTDAGTIKCNEAGEEMTIAFMKGTFYNEVKAVADEHLWYSEETMSVPDYEMTKNGFIILSLPGSLDDGDYISVMGTGLIRISDENRPVQD